MALIVETGTGLANADSFVSVADADARMTAIGSTLWATLTTDEKEQAIRRATIYMEQVYRQSWKGSRISQTQALSWPRYGVVADGFDVLSTTVPVEIANACIDLALKAAADDLAPDLERGVLREKVGPIETEFDPNSPQAKRYRAVDNALAAFLKGAAAVAMLVRV